MKALDKGAGGHNGNLHPATPTPKNITMKTLVQSIKQFHT